MATQRPQRLQLGEQNQDMLEPQDRRARRQEEEQRQAAEAGAGETREQEHKNEMRKREEMWLGDEWYREMLETLNNNAIDREEPGKGREIGARLQSKEQNIKDTQERQGLWLENDKSRKMLPAQARQSQDEEEQRCKAGYVHVKLEPEELEAIHKSERLRLEAEARRVREQEEEHHEVEESQRDDQSREMLKTKAGRAREQEEECSKTGEARAEQAREQEFKVMWERRRLLLEAATRRAREEKEERRKAEEARYRQKQELRAPLEREGWRFEEQRQREMNEAKAGRIREWAKAPLDAAQGHATQKRELEAKWETREIQRQHQAVERQPCLRLPKVCRRRTMRQDCADPNCQQLHICRLFLADICKYGVTCRYGHSLTTVHNQMVCNQHHLDTGRELVSLQQLRRDFYENDEIPEAIRVNNLETCDEFSSRSSCLQSECNRIHICRQYVAGVCGRAICRFGHDLHTTHNNRVLSRHRLTTMTDDQILNILREKETGGPQRAYGATTTVNSKNGAKATASSSKNGAKATASSSKSGAKTTASSSKNGAKATASASKNGAKGPKASTASAKGPIATASSSKNEAKATASSSKNGTKATASSPKNGAIANSSKNGAKTTVSSDKNGPKATASACKNKAKDTKATANSCKNGAKATASSCKNKAKDTSSSSKNGATATGSSAKNGAIPRQRSYGARNQTNKQRGKKGQEGEKSPAAAGLSEELQCPVCLEMFNRATTLGCGHTFCAGCLQEVRDRSGDRCPLCRVNITSAIRSVTLDNIIRTMTAKQ